MLLRTIFLSLTFLSVTCLMAQDKPIYKEREKPEDVWKKRLQNTFVALNLTPSLGGNQLGAYISPTLGYHVTDNFNVAAGPLYMFNSFRFTTSSGTTSRNTTSIWGGRLWAQHRLYQTFFAHAEYEVMNALKMFVDNSTIPASRYYDPSGTRQLIGNPLLGLAFVNEGDRAAQSLTILYNLNNLPNFTPYSTLLNAPIVIRATLSFNLVQE